MVDTNDCWLFAGWLDPEGYGSVRVAGRNYKVHRLMYEEMIAEIPRGLVIDHLCRVRHCVNPKHMEAVTIGENVLRGKSHITRQVQQTHCLRGHEFSHENTYIPPRRWSRQCRECMKVRQRKTQVSL